MNDWQSTAGYWGRSLCDGKTGWERDDAHPALRDWIASGELKPCSIAIPGCGRGHESVALVESGFEVTAIDFADAALEETRERLRGFEASATLVQSDVLSYRPGLPFDAVYEQTCMCAIEPAMRTQYQDSLFEWLRPRREVVCFVHADQEQLWRTTIPLRHRANENTISGRAMGLANQNSRAI